MKRYTDTSAANHSYYKYDSLLGWTVNPNHISWDSLYHSNSQGIRSGMDYSVPKDSSSLRIAVFGDSFTEGYQVSNNETWSYFLEEGLNSKGIKTEVLNYGVPGYGIDQAYLRWKTEGYKMNPDIVVLGLNWENFWRNVNTFRPNYHRKAGILLTKPRAIIVGDTLSWVNVPTIQPKSILDRVIMNFDKSELYKFEYFNDTELYSENLLNNSYVYLLMRDRFLGHRSTSFEDCLEGQRLTWKLIETFAKEANMRGSDFIILHLLQPDELEQIKNSEEFEYQELLNQIIDTYPFCNTGRSLEKFDAESIYEKTANHPTAFANKLIGEHFSEYLMQRQMNNVTIEQK